MRRLFRPVITRGKQEWREHPADENEWCLPPFYRQRALSRGEFFGALELYVEARTTEYRSSVQQVLPKYQATTQEQKRWPDLRGLTTRKEFWKYWKAVARLYYAETKEEQRKARKRSKQLSIGGPIERRKLLAEARKATPQAHKTLSSMDLLLSPEATVIFTDDSGRKQRRFYGLVGYRAARRFVWSFLYHEARERKINAPRPKPTTEQIAAELSKAYPFLGLTPTLIVKGLRDLKVQPDRDVAKKFGLRPSTIKSLLSKSNTALR